MKKCKISGLTRDNVRALEETHQDSIASGNLVLTPTTATWAVSPSGALANLEGVMANLPTKGHPRASLHAVVRKLAKLAADWVEPASPVTDSEEEDTPDDEITEPVPAREAIPVIADEDVPEGLSPLDPAAIFLLTLGMENAFEKIGTEPEGFLTTYRCKVCNEEGIARQNRVNHFAVDRARSRWVKAEINQNRRADMASKTTKTTAKDQGFPSVYLADNGNFKPGLDASAKSDLVASYLGGKGKRHTFSKEEAKKLLDLRGWFPFVAKREASIEAEKARKAKAAKKAKENAASKKETGAGTGGNGEVTPDPKPTSKPKPRGGRVRASA